MAIRTQRIRRFLALAPAFVYPPAQGLALTRRLCETVSRQVFESVRAFCKDLETERRLELGGQEERAERGYVIVAASYTPNSAGIGCLYRLCDELNRRGYPSFVAGSTRTTQRLTAPLIGWGRAKKLCAQGYTAVYAETTAGNPLRARSVARWVLNRPGLLGGECVYDMSEKVFYYSEVYRSYIRNPIAGKLYMPTIDEDLFYCDDSAPSHRALECVYVGKSTWQEGIVDRSRVFEITRDFPSKRELGKLFRASRILYCFDNSTILIYEALMCGCPVVIIPDGTQSKADYQQLELGMDGIAWGLEEAGQLRANVVGLRERYQRAKQAFREDLQRFIDVTQSPGRTSSARHAA